jgi:hypothetical protein
MGNVGRRIAIIEHSMLLLAEFLDELLGIVQPFRMQVVLDLGRATGSH